MPKDKETAALQEVSSYTSATDIAADKSLAVDKGSVVVGTAAAVDFAGTVLASVDLDRGALAAVS